MYCWQFPNQLRGPQIIPSDLRSKLSALRGLPQETEWLEFRFNRDQKDVIGENLSALTKEQKSNRTGNLLQEMRTSEIVTPNHVATGRSGNWLKLAGESANSVYPKNPKARDVSAWI
jgi:hypothetical protein